MKIMSVGGGTEQLYPIEVAKSKGHEIICVDANENCVARDLCDKFYGIDIKDRERVLEIALSEKIDCILPSPIGRYLTTVGYINDKLKLKGISQNAANISTDKVILNNLFKKNGKLIANQLVGKTYMEIIKAVDEVGLPCILKPRHGSGSRGVIVIEESSSVESLIMEHLESCNENDETIIEELLFGEEFGVDGVLIDGNVEILNIRKKIITDLPYRQEVGYISPILEKRELITNYFSEICKIMNLDNSFINSDILIRDNQIQMIEISGRPGGLNTTSKILKNSVGVNIYEEFLKYLNNDTCSFEIKYEKPYVFRYISFAKGILLDMPNLDEYKDKGIIEEYTFNLELNDKTDLVKNGNDLMKYGYFTVKAENIIEAEKITEKIISEFKIKEF